MHRTTRRTAAALAAASSLVAAAPAGAATVHGTVIGHPALHGSSATVPVLVGGAAAPLAKLRVPAARIRRADGAKLTTSDLRVGDAVTAEVSRTFHTQRLRVTRRGAAPSFGSIDTTLATAGDDARAAANEARTLAQQTGDVTAQQNVSASDLRTQLLAVRTNVNLLIGSLRATSTGLGDAVAAIAAARPADPAKRATVTKAQQPYLQPLSDIATSDAAAADQLDVAVGHLDETINAVGTTSNPALPVQTTATASDVLTAIVQIVSAVRVPGLPGG